MWALYLAAAFQFGWIALAEARFITFDPYPFAFLLFISSLLQLVFMFVIMVGQDVLGRAREQRAQLTFLDAEAVVHECRRLQRHLTAQDKAIGAICSYVEAEAPHDHPLRRVCQVNGVTSVSVVYFRPALRRPSKVMSKALRAAFVRREALLIRVEVKGHHRRAVAAAWLELRTAGPGRRRDGQEQS